MADLWWKFVWQLQDYFFWQISCQNYVLSNSLFKFIPYLGVVSQVCISDLPWKHQQTTRWRLFSRFGIDIQPNINVCLSKIFWNGLEFFFCLKTNFSIKMLLMIFILFSGSDKKPMKVWRSIFQAHRYMAGPPLGISQDGCSTKNTKKCHMYHVFRDAFPWFFKK